MTALNKSIRTAILKAVRDVRPGITAVEYKPRESGGMDRKEIVSFSEVNRLLSSPDFLRGWSEAATRIREVIEFIVKEETTPLDLRRYAGKFDTNAAAPSPAEIVAETINRHAGAEAAEEPDVYQALRNLLTAVQASVSMVGTNDTLQRAINGAESALLGTCANGSEQRTPARRVEDIPTPGKLLE